MSKWGQGFLEIANSRIPLRRRTDLIAIYARMEKAYKQMWQKYVEGGTVDV
jgi:hypothetical protein